MGLVQADIALGREVELYNRVNSNDPANSALVIAVLATTAEATSLLRTYATLATLLAANPEVTNGDYARKTLTDADLANYTVDTTNHQITLEIPLLTWSAGGGPDAGDSWDYAVVCYDSDTTGGTDANIVPISFHELRIGGFAIVPNGSPIVVDLTAGFVRASSR